MHAETIVHVHHACMHVEYIITMAHNYCTEARGRNACMLYIMYTLSRTDWYGDDVELLCSA